MPMLVALATLLVFAAPRSVGAEQLRAGVAVEGITRPHPTVAIHDPLYVKVLVVDDGKTEATIICLDIVVASVKLVADIRRRLQEKLGIAPASVLVSATHNHHTEDQEALDIPKRTLKAVRRAREAMVPVKIGVTSGREDRITMNRRLLLEDGGQWTIRRANPSPRDSDVVAVGPIDTEIGILRLDRADGRPLAVLYNFACHAYGGVPDGGATADLPGYASAVLEQALGHGAVAIFLQGAAGDITPIRYKDVDAPPPTERLGTMLGLSTLKAVSHVAMHEGGRVGIISETIALPRRHDLDARIRSLQAEQEKILQFYTGVGCGSHGAGTFLNFKTFLPLYLKHAIDPNQPSYSSYLYLQEAATGRDDLKHLDAENRKRLQKYLAAIEQMERLIRLRSNLHLLEQLRGQENQGNIRAEIQALRIGEFVVVTFPGEPFAEVGLRIKTRSPCKYTFVAGYANGFFDYAPTAESYRSPCYENSLTPFAPEWEDIYETKVLEMIRRLNSDRRAQSATR